MLRILATIFAALLGLCFGSFLNVCLSRWPAGESIVHPRSHCRACARTLAWWENLPLLSWIALRGRCRTCSTWISIRYPLVEAAVAILWAATVWNRLSPGYSMDVPSTDLPMAVTDALCYFAFYWIIVALAILDFEHLWLPDWLTLPGLAVGLILENVEAYVNERAIHIGIGLVGGVLMSVLGILAAAGIILLIRFLYQLIRHREGLGLGDAKLMAMLAAWLGLPGALISLFLGVVLGALYAVTMLLARSRRTQTAWATVQLPLGTFLCIGGIVSALWGQQILAAYLRLFP
jgi:leader peptidase (prepilin peptidase) / N-methyltransferase